MLFVNCIDENKFIIYNFLGGFMYTVKNNIEKTIIVNKSKFISKSYFVTDTTQASSIINRIKDEYSDATHVCFGYIINNNIKYSDDGEPNNTAGMPIYNVISKNNLNFVLIVVIRYFGGIKLGAGGLTRAYSNSALEVINDNITELSKGYNIEITLDYNSIKDVEYILKDINIINKEYNDIISITFEIPIDNIDTIKEKLNNHIKSFSIINDTYIRK